MQRNRPFIVRSVTKEMHKFSFLNITVPRSVPLHHQHFPPIIFTLITLPILSTYRIKYIYKT